MKISLLITLLLSTYSYAQTNTYLRIGVPENKVATTCSGNSFKRNGEVSYFPANITPQWYFSSTNIKQLTFTNTLPWIQWGDFNGQNGCGHSPVYITNSDLTVGYRFSIYWPTNKSLPFPTNQQVPLITVGFTNASDTMGPHAALMDSLQNLSEGYQQLIELNKQEISILDDMQKSNQKMIDDLDQIIKASRDLFP